MFVAGSCSRVGRDVVREREMGWDSRCQVSPTALRDFPWIWWAVRTLRRLEWGW